MNPIVLAAVISSISTLAGVFLSTWLQTRRINLQNKLALHEQTKQLIGELDD